MKPNQITLHNQCYACAVDHDFEPSECDSCPIKSELIHATIANHMCVRGITYHPEAMDDPLEFGFDHPCDAEVIEISLENSDHSPFFQFDSTEVGINCEALIESVLGIHSCDSRSNLANFIKFNDIDQDDPRIAAEVMGWVMKRKSIL